MQMTWEKLLSSRRVRDLQRGAASFRSEGDLRSEFDRDYDRTVFSAPIRRLHDKAQVFPLDSHDAVRTRLTHSLEVSTLARGLARNVGLWLRESGVLTRDWQVDALESIAATCGLVHDLGNPPFGHAGELAIQEWFARRMEADPSIAAELRSTAGGDQLVEDFRQFEGNAQTIRIISRLQFIADFSGLNYTSATLSAALKYLAPSNGLIKNRHAWRKPGYFASESELVHQIREETGTGDARNPMAFLVEACDDTVYATVDLEDGVKKKVVSWEEVEAQIRVTGGSLAVAAIDRARDYIERADPPLGPHLTGEAMAQMFRTFAIGAIEPAIRQSFKDNYDQIMKGHFEDELLRTSEAWQITEACKNFSREHVYSSPDILRLELMGRRVIHDLLDYFWEGSGAYSGERVRPRRFSEKLYSLTSPYYRRVFERDVAEGRFPRLYSRLQLSTDYVCGMTDSFACSLHRKLTTGG